MPARAFAAAALALLIGGDSVRLGWDAIGLWHFLFPYLWLFVLLETARAKGRVEDGEVFLAGAAMAMLYGGVYAKDLQHGLHPFGIDWPGSVCAAFDGGMTTVLALHVAERAFPRAAAVSEDSAEPGGPVPQVLTLAFLAFVAGTGAAVYGVKTAFNFYRADRMLGPTWLVSDILFLATAAVLARRAWRDVTEGEAAQRPSWVWLLAGFAVWLPGASLTGRACLAAGLPSVLMYFFVGAWTAASWGLGWRLWRERGHAETAPQSGARPAMTAALWRAGGALMLIAMLGYDLNAERTAGLFSVLIDWPSRALFAWAFLTSRLKV